MDTPSAVCDRFGLDITKLEIEDLLKNRSYRRLYNIVATDQASTRSIFRPNLIKELYFLLQMTPFIEDVLQDHFLNNIEEWYNCNDHKKIQLSKNLQKKVETIIKPKEAKDGSIRPKTGVQWDSSLNPFLRPYTAKMRKNMNRQQNSHEKMEKQGIQSTKANTCEQESNQHQSCQIKNVVDIEEQWERSQDFTKKYRTLHPEEQPTYEKLINLIERASMMGSEVDDSTYITKQKTKPKRQIQSAMINREKAKQIAEEELAQVKNVEQNIQVNGQENKEVQQENQFNEFQEKDDENEEQENEVGQADQVIFNNVKCFTKDERSKNGNKQGRMYTRVNGQRIVRQFTGKQAAIIQRLNAYSSLTQNNAVRRTEEDSQFCDHYQEYIRKRTSLKREQSRKTESMRMLQSAKQQRTRPSVLKTGFLNKQNQAPKSLTAKRTNQPKQFVLSPPFPLLESQKCQDKKLLTHYNKTEFFKKYSTFRVKTSLRNLGDNKIDRQPELQEVVQPMLTKNQRFTSQFKFNPLNIESRDQYNEQILEDIQKIKEKFGGKFAISTQALMKALYIQTPVAPLEFQIPNKDYTMLTNGEKKKKKKGKKLKKTTKPKAR